MKINRDDLNHAEDLLAKAHTLTDNAITIVRTNNPDDIERAIQRLASATQYQNVILKNLCSAIANLYKAIEKS